MDESDQPRESVTMDDVPTQEGTPVYDDPYKEEREFRLRQDRRDRQSRLRERIEDAERDGWILEEEREFSARLYKRHFGGWGENIVLLIISFGIGNLLYMPYKWLFDKKTKVVRAYP